MFGKKIDKELSKSKAIWKLKRNWFGDISKKRRSKYLVWLTWLSFSKRHLPSAFLTPGGNMLLHFIDVGPVTCFSQRGVDRCTEKMGLTWAYLWYLLLVSCFFQWEEYALGGQWFKENERYREQIRNQGTVWTQCQIGQVYPHPAKSKTHK
jgi:hypothetical protein